MPLEDHAGDVVRKAREMAGIPPETAAHAAGLTRTELSAFESEGIFPEKIAWSPLAKLLNLNATRLEWVARGWEPSVPKLATWRHLRRLTTREGGMDVHCYLVWDEQSLQAALFDTGFEPSPVFQSVLDQSLRLEHLFITHSHYDHVSGVEALVRKFPGLQVHADAPRLASAKSQRTDAPVQVGGLRVLHRATPGHAADGASYVISGWPDGAPPVVVVGDALFAGSLGGAPGRGVVARGKVREHILSLPPATLICPGHGPCTTVAQELENNPFA